MLTRRESKRNGSSTPRPNLQKSTNGSNEIKVKRDSSRVKVYVRVRPFSKDEQAKKANAMPFEILQDFTQLHVFSDERGHSEKTYSFDHVFSMKDQNKEVSGTLTQPLVHAAMNGFNGTLMAYGQTGAGKTHSLMSDDGITKTLIDKCFTQIFDDVKHNYKVTVSYLQIYQEKIFDLLSGVNNSKGDLAIRENPRTGVYVDNLSDYVVRSPSEVLQYIASGKKKLVFAETKMNRTSSRSHAVLQMVIERTMKDEVDEEIIAKQQETKTENGNINQTEDEEGELDLNAFGKDVIIRGKIHICDLAGSERIKRTGASGDRLNEAQYINSSLLELGNVIQALADESKKHVPFRNSVLTRLLQESLGGNCKTSLIVCVSPSTRDIQETKCTLNFGSRAMKVTNTAYVNMEVDFKSLSDQLLKQLQSKEDEIHKIRLSIKEQVERERQQIKDEYEGNDGKLTTMLDEQKKEFQEEMTSLQETLNNLQNDNINKTQDVKDMEEAIVLLDDNSKIERSFILQILNSEQELTRFSSPSTAHQRIAYLISLIQNKMQSSSEQNLTIDEAVEMLSTMRDELDAEENQGDWKVDRDTVVIDDIHQQINVLRDTLGENNVAMACKQQKVGQDFYTICIKLFLLKRIQHFKEFLTRFEELNMIKTQAKETAEAKEALEALQALAAKNILEDSDQVDGVCKYNNVATQATPFGVNIGVQAEIYPQTAAREDKFTETDPCTQASELVVDSSMRASHNELETHSIGTQSPVHPKPFTEDAVDGTPSDTITDSVSDYVTPRKSSNPPELHAKKSHEIFQGFSSTLNRIEDLVKTDRSVSRTPSFNMGGSLNLGGSLSSRSDNVAGALSHRSDGAGSYRSGSSIGMHRYDDPYTSKYSSPYTTSFSGSTSNRLSTDTYESKYTPRSYASPMYSSSKYDNNRSYGGGGSGSMLGRYNSMENVSSSSDYKGGFRGSSGDLSLYMNSNSNEGNKDEIKKLEDKIKQLENTVKEVQLENQEYVVLVQELSRSFPNDEQLREIKRNVTGKIADCITVGGGRKENVKVARIEPFSKDKQDKSINVKYDFVDGKSITPDTETKNENVTYDIHVNVVRNIKKKRTPSDNSNLIEFSPDVEQTPERLSSESYLNSVEGGETDNSPGNRIRPQTWYEGARTPDLNARSEKNRNNSLKPGDLERLDVDPYNSDEVVFSKSSSSSLTLPGWMKLKKKPTTNQSKSIVTEVIQ